MEFTCATKPEGIQSKLAGPELSTSGSKELHASALGTA
jgi:hypothetical protein